ncbi:hypothetical protein [Arenibacter algicola]|uniref:Uncharacterized protein n=1 Tax=Arenibacter algicola TaxID=616991 RepID=A0A221UUU0_9FLAO|nr:hypothetical protein [Arenibacter algicola]ASO05115.1 hypothetical protein AREALGSMS7_01647 [Arenibacter algicola]
MDLDLLITWIFVLVLVVYLTQLPIRRLNAFGNFLKKVLGVIPISKMIQAIGKRRNVGKTDK